MGNKLEQLINFPKKGALGFFRDSRIYRPTWAEINSSNFVSNLRITKKLLGNKSKILAVVKANAYGHGAVELSKLALKEGAWGLGVASIEEALALRDAGVRGRILLLGSVYPMENLKYTFEYGFTPTISSLGGLRDLKKLARSRNKCLAFHLKVDTGMGRVGAQVKNSSHMIDEIVCSKEIYMEGLYTHFSCSGSSRDFTLQQFDKFRDVKEYAKASGLKFISHAANSSAVINYEKTHLDMARPGLMLYGLVPDGVLNTKPQLKPVMSWKSRIVFLKKLPKNAPVSYGRTFFTKRNTTVATLPLGYADGYSRSLSNKGHILLNGKRCPVIGRVTMDMIMADVTDAGPVSIGDEIVIIGSSGKQKISCEEVAAQCNTISYETACAISYRVPRVIV